MCDSQIRGELHKPWFGSKLTHELSVYLSITEYHIIVSTVHMVKVSLVSKAKNGLGWQMSFVFVCLFESGERNM